MEFSKKHWFTQTQVQRRRTKSNFKFFLFLKVKFYKIQSKHWNSRKLEKQIKGYIEPGKSK